MLTGRAYDGKPQWQQADFPSTLGGVFVIESSSLLVHNRRHSIVLASVFSSGKD